MADGKGKVSEVEEEERFEIDIEMNTTTTTQNSDASLTGAETQSGEINNGCEESESRSGSQRKSIVPTNELDTSGCGEQQPLSDSLLVDKDKSEEGQEESRTIRESSVTSPTVSITRDEIQPVDVVVSSDDLSKTDCNEVQNVGSVLVNATNTIPPVQTDTDNKSPDSDNEIEGDSEIWFDTREDTASVSGDSLRAASVASIASEVVNPLFFKVESDRQSPISRGDKEIGSLGGEIPPPPDFDDENCNNDSPSEITSSLNGERSTLETVNSCSHHNVSPKVDELETEGKDLDSVAATHIHQPDNKSMDDSLNSQCTKDSRGILCDNENLEKNKIAEEIAEKENSELTNTSFGDIEGEDSSSVGGNDVNVDYNRSAIEGNSKKNPDNLDLKTISKTDRERETNRNTTDPEEEIDELVSDEDDDEEDGELLNLETGGVGGRASHNSGRRSSFARRGSVCEEGYVENSIIMDYLVDVQDGAEARLAARRQARAEAREIRMKELEKQQKESEENADRHYDMYSSGNDVANRAAFRVALGSHRGPAHSVGSGSYHSSRRSSEDSSEDGVVNIRDMRHELKELEDKFRKSMVQNAQLDNEKSALTYHVELLKDKIEDLEESLSLLQREHKDKCRDFENLKRLSTQLKDELEYYKSQLQEKDELIKEYGLVVVENEVEVDLGNGERETRIKRTLVTQQTAQVLSTLGDGSLDVRLKKVLEEKNELLDEIRRLKLDLEEERNRNAKGDRSGGLQNNISHNSSHTMNGPDGHASHDTQREATKQMADYRFKTQKYEQEIATLQANVTRLETQVARFKTAAEDAESREDDLKVEKRKLQREFREAQSKLDELETTNSHLQKRLDKLKTAKSALLKEL